MKIRMATDEDCRSLATLKRKVWETTYRGIYPNEKIDKYDMSLNERKFKDMIKQQSQKLFVVLNDSEIIGYMSCGKIMRAFDEHTHDIGLLYLLKEYQGKGIGLGLFEFAKKELKSQGVTEFIVSCNKYNLCAQQFYKKMGGKIIKVDEDNEDKSIPQVKFQFVDKNNINKNNDLYINSLFNQYCYKTKFCTSFDLALGESPYYDVDDIEQEDLQYRQEYVDLCVETSMHIWNKCGFSNEFIVLYEDKYSCHKKNEKEFIENNIQSLECIEHMFKWNDDEEIYDGVRYIWRTNNINVKEIFKKIILSDIGGNTELDCSVYIIDNKTNNVFFLYDDRGIDIYSSDKDFLNKISRYIRI